MSHTFLSGLKDLDAALWGQPGIPGGSLVEIVGEDSAGKTGLALHFAAVAARDPELLGAWIETECPLTPENLQWADIDPETLLLVPQRPGVPGLGAACELLEAGVQLVVIDSLTALLASEEEATLRATLSRDLPRLKDLAEEKGALVLFTNQERSVPGTRVVTHAGSCAALNRFLDATIRLETGDTIRWRGVPVGVMVRWSLLQPGPDYTLDRRRGRFKLFYAHGLTDLGARVRGKEL